MSGESQLPDRIVFYVGRTGDSSSQFAASPFLRIGRHLDFRSTAKANSLAKHLKAQGIVPARCTFEMVALGPFFQEQKSLELHRRYRDQIAAVESYVAQRFESAGYKPLGDTKSRKTCPPELLQRADQFLSEYFPETRKAQPSVLR